MYTFSDPQLREKNEYDTRRACKNMSQDGNKTPNKQTVQNIAAMSPPDAQQTDSEWPLGVTRTSPLLYYSLLYTDTCSLTHTQIHTPDQLFSDGPQCPQMSVTHSLNTPPVDTSS